MTTAGGNMKGIVMATEVYRGKKYSKIEIDDPRYTLSKGSIWVEGDFVLGLKADITISFQEG